MQIFVHSDIDTTHISKLRISILITLIHLFLFLFQACPAGWHSFQTSCYHLPVGKKSWYSAKLECSSNNGAQLVKIDSSEENDFIKTTFLADGAGYWIGLTDEETEGVWKWSDGSILAGFQKWPESQPSGKPLKNCGGIRMGSFLLRNYDAEWHDNECEDRRGYICEN